MPDFAGTATRKIDDEEIGTIVTHPGLVLPHRRRHLRRSRAHRR
jgi:hypothetical protein